MSELTDQGRRVVEQAAQDHGFRQDAVRKLLAALEAAGGAQVQFDDPELGGLGQWSAGGMIMIGDMFNDALKHRVANLCADLAARLRGDALFARTSAGRSRAGSSMGGSQRWPSSLGVPASTGSQNDMHYAVFPAARRLAVERGDKLTVYDTGEHRIGGVSQQQGHDQSLAFTSQLGRVALSDLSEVETGSEAAAPATLRPAVAAEDVIGKIERLFDLRQREIITAQEFDAKKAELLARL
jgi:hypothetical protein